MAGTAVVRQARTMSKHTLTITLDAEITDEAALVEAVESDTPEDSLSPDDIREEDRAASSLVAGVSKALKDLSLPGVTIGEVPDRTVLPDGAPSPSPPASTRSPPSTPSPRTSVRPWPRSTTGQVRTKSAELRSRRSLCGPPCPSTWSVTTCTARPATTTKTPGSVAAVTVSIASGVASCLSSVT